MTPELAIAFGNLALTIIIFLYAIRKFLHERHRAASQENLKALIGIYESIQSNQELLSCIGIAKEDLDRDGITVEQLVFSLRDFTAAMLYYDSKAEGNKDMFLENSYRYNLCQKEYTRKVWPHLKPHFIGYAFGKMMTKTIQHLEQQELRTKRNQSRSPNHAPGSGSR